MLVTLKNVSMSFPQDDSAVDVLSEASLTIAEGDFVCLTGASGIGKSTVLNMIAGLCEPTAGDVIFQERNVYSLTDSQRADMRLKNIGFVFQTYKLIPELSAWENIMLPLHMSKKRVEMAYLQNICDMLNINNRLNHYPMQLSGGQQQRVAIARALATRPDLLLADEPTGNLDRALADEVMDLICDIHRTYHPGILLVTHDQDVARRARMAYKIENGAFISAPMK